MNQSHPGRPLRVLGIAAGLDMNGATVQLRDALEGVDRGKIEFTLCVLIDGGRLRPQFEKIGIPLVDIHRRSRFDLRALWRLHGLIRRGNYDVIYTIKHTAALWGRAAAMLAGARGVVTHEHGYPLAFDKGITAIVDGIQSRACDLILANSRFTGQLVCSRLKVAPDRVRVLYNSVEDSPGPESESALALRELRGGDRRLVGYVGRLSPEKGCDLLLRAAPEILARDEACEIVICGDGPARPELEALARDLGIEHRTHFRGWVDRPVDVMREMDLLVVPSIYESHGRVILEAALAGVPVVAAAVGGMVEALDAVKNGLAVEPTLTVEARNRDWQPLAASWTGVDLRRAMMVDPEILADRVCLLLGDRDLRHRLIADSAERVRAGFSLDAHVRQFEDALLAAASARR